MTNDGAPDWIYLEKTKRKKFYEELTKKRKASPFYKKEYWEIFVLSMAMGYYNNCPESLKKRDKSIPFSTIRHNDEVIWLIKSIAISEKGIDVLLDEKEVYKISEEYANGGIGLLWDAVMGGHPGDPEKRLEAEVIEILENK